jgi:hypothetical protein
MQKYIAFLTILSPLYLHYATADLSHTCQSDSATRPLGNQHSEVFQICSSSSLTPTRGSAPKYYAHTQISPNCMTSPTKFLAIALIPLAYPDCPPSPLLCAPYIRPLPCSSFCLNPSRGSAPKYYAHTQISPFCMTSPPKFLDVVLIAPVSSDWPPSPLLCAPYSSPLRCSSSYHTPTRGSAPMHFSTFT